MAQLERPQRPVEASKTIPTLHTMEQLLRGEGSKSLSKSSKLSPLSAKLSKLSPTYSSSLSSSSSSSNSQTSSSPFFQRFRHHDSEEDHGHGHSQKKSVLTKVKEKAKKLRHSLSKKKHEDGSHTPKSGHGLQDDAPQEGAEYNGAPIYQSKKADEGQNENEMQQPKVTLVTPQKNVASVNGKPGLEEGRQKSLTRSKSKRTTQVATAPALATATAAATTATKAIDASSNNTVNKTTAEKLTPASNDQGSDQKNSLTSKFQGLTVFRPQDLHSSTSSPKDATQNSSVLISAPSTPGKVASKSSPTARTSSAPVTPNNSSAPVNEKNTGHTAQLWDKGISVKEYLMNKLEPGEDEKALSQVISEVMSPSRTPGDAGVMEKVREAVNSLLRTEEPKKEADTNTATINTITTSTTSQTPVSTNVASTSSQIPVSTISQGEVQEENLGRILQAN